MLGDEEIGIGNLVYPATRYRQGQSPNSMYIPGRHLLFKMMRATLGCRTEKDLWFNRHFGACESDHDSQISHEHDHAGLENLNWDLQHHEDKNHDSDGTPSHR